MSVSVQINWWGVLASVVLCFALYVGGAWLKVWVDAKIRYASRRELLWLSAGELAGLLAYWSGLIGLVLTVVAAIVALPFLAS